MSDFLSRLNPLFKFILVIAVSTSLAITRSMQLNVGVFAACTLLMLAGARPARWLKAARFLVPVTLFAFSIFMTVARFGSEAAWGFGVDGFAENSAGLNLATRVFAFAGLGLLFSLTTAPNDLVNSMRKDAKLPRKFAYGIMCALNLLPYIRNEYANARLAFQVRGVRLSVFSPKPVFSMLVNCFRWSEVLSMAMISKGFCEESSSGRCCERGKSVMT